MRAAVALLALLLVGCNTQKPDVSATIENVATPENIRLACEASLISYAVFEAVAAQKVKPSTATKIRAGFASISVVCANPPKNSAEAMVAILSAVRAWRAEVEKATRDASA